MTSPSLCEKIKFIFGQDLIICTFALMVLPIEACAGTLAIAFGKSVPPFEVPHEGNLVAEETTKKKERKKESSKMQRS
jgi:hypothetical protein